MSQTVVRENVYRLGGLLRLCTSNGREQTTLIAVRERAFVAGIWLYAELMYFLDILRNLPNIVKTNGILDHRCVKGSPMRDPYMAGLFHSKVDVVKSAEGMFIIRRVFHRTNYHAFRKFFVLLQWQCMGIPKFEGFV